MNCDRSRCHDKNEQFLYLRIRIEPSGERDRAVGKKLSHVSMIGYSWLSWSSLRGTSATTLPSNSAERPTYQSHLFICAVYLTHILIINGTDPSLILANHPAVPPELRPLDAHASETFTLSAPISSPVWVSHTLRCVRSVLLLLSQRSCRHHTPFSVPFVR